jgi:hypothetical protein
VLTAVRAWVEEQPTAQPRRTIAKFAPETAVKQDLTLSAIYERPTER